MSRKKPMKAKEGKKPIKEKPRKQEEIVPIHMGLSAQLNAVTEVMYINGPSNEGLNLKLYTENYLRNKANNVLPTPKHPLAHKLIDGTEKLTEEELRSIRRLIDRKFDLEMNPKLLEYSNKPGETSKCDEISTRIVQSLLWQDKKKVSVRELMEQLPEEVARFLNEVYLKKVNEFNPPQFMHETMELLMSSYMISAWFNAAMRLISFQSKKDRKPATTVDIVGLLEKDRPHCRLHQVISTYFPTVQLTPQEERAPPIVNPPPILLIISRTAGIKIHDLTLRGHQLLTPFAEDFRDFSHEHETEKNYCTVLINIANKPFKKIMETRLANVMVWLESVFTENSMDDCYKKMTHACTDGGMSDEEYTAKTFGSYVVVQDTYRKAMYRNMLPIDVHSPAFYATMSTEERQKHDDDRKAFNESSKKHQNLIDCFYEKPAWWNRQYRVRNKHWVLPKELCSNVKSPILPTGATAYWRAWTDEQVLEWALKFVSDPTDVIWLKNNKLNTEMLQTMSHEHSYWETLGMKQSLEAKLMRHFSQVRTAANQSTPLWFTQ